MKQDKIKADKELWWNYYFTKPTSMYHLANSMVVGDWFIELLKEFNLN